MSTFATIRVLNRINETDHPWMLPGTGASLMRGVSLADGGGTWFLNCGSYYSVAMLSKQRARIGQGVFNVSIEFYILSTAMVEKLACYEKASQIDARDSIVFPIMPIPWAFRRQISFARAWAVPLPDDLRRVVFSFLNHT